MDCLPVARPIQGLLGGDRDEMLFHHQDTAIIQFPKIRFMRRSLILKEFQRTVRIWMASYNPELKRNIRRNHSRILCKILMLYIGNSG
jgi:hypothetical protein